MDELQAFYDAAFPRLDDALAYLEQFPLDALPDDATRLLWLYCALMTVSFPVEVWRQPRVPDSGASTFDVVLEPAVLIDNETIWRALRSSAIGHHRGLQLRRTLHAQQADLRRNHHPHDNTGKIIKRQHLTIGLRP